ncbi:DUF4238 domain-containing protein [Henriciella aquimarina]|uniref:DUF4238 domain-containing protein n=1 Tax=Henriciella aquimarina TaxID=545261 RepID=UPI001301FF69|nr:DUF4238 domain-containing protein [Henriciella aquimarina]
MSNPKKHHFVPQQHIERFKSEDGKFWYYDRDKPQRGVEHRDAASIFYIRQHNTLVSSDGKRDYSVEKELSKIEGRYKDIADKVIDDVGSGIAPQLSMSGRRFLREYILLQWRRSPDFLKHETAPDSLEKLAIASREIEKSSGISLTINETRILAEYSSGRRALDVEVLTVFRKMTGDEYSTLSDQQLAALLKGGDAQNGRKAGEVAGRYERIPAVSDRVNSMRMWYVALPLGLSFVLGSLPVASVSVPGQTSAHPLRGIVFPITSGLAVVLGSPNAPFSMEVVNDRQWVRQVNRTIARMSGSFGSRSEKLTQSLAQA